MEVFSASRGDLGDVTLDGEKIMGVLECCPEGGYVIVTVRDADGKLVIDGDEIRTERSEGVVTFTRWAK